MPLCLKEQEPRAKRVNPRLYISKAKGKAKPTSTGTKTTKRTTGKKCKAKRLKKREIQSICSNLRDVDIELRADLARQINSGYHL